MFHKTTDLVYSFIIELQISTFIYPKTTDLVSPLSQNYIF